MVPVVGEPHHVKEVSTLAKLVGHVEVATIHEALVWPGPIGHSSSPPPVRLTPGITCKRRLNSGRRAACQVHPLVGRHVRPPSPVHSSCLLDAAKELTDIATA